MKVRNREEFIVYNRDKKKLRSYTIRELPILREVIVQKSIHFFSDPEPCFIHSNAVVLRLAEEIKASLKAEHEPIFINVLPREIQGYMDLGKEVTFIEYCSYK